MTLGSEPISVIPTVAAAIYSANHETLDEVQEAFMESYRSGEIFMGQPLADSLCDFLRDCYTGPGVSYRAPVPGPPPRLPYGPRAAKSPGPVSLHSLRPVNTS